ncbi:MAG: flavin reductase family protein [bacterium]|nr:flavin reductase family protein [bacterium]
MAVSAEDFKASLGCRATGVSIVTSRDGDRIHGMTVSDFASVSLEPPLVLVSASKTTRTLELILAGKCFALNILTAEQQDLSNLFASKSKEGTRFEGLETREAVTGSPLIPGAKVNLDCTLEATHEAGDHVLCVGRVEYVKIREAEEPLVYYQGHYRDLVRLDD